MKLNRNEELDGVIVKCKYADYKTIDKRVKCVRRTANDTTLIEGHYKLICIDRE